MAVWPHRQDGSHGGELQNGDFRSRVLHDIRNPAEAVIEKSDSGLMVRSVGKLRQQINAPVRAEVLNRVAKNLRIADDREDIVRAVYRGTEEADCAYSADGASRTHKIPDPEWAKDYEEDTGCEVGEKTAPCCTDGESHAREEGCKGRSLDVEEAEKRFNERDVEDDLEAGCDVGDNRCVNRLPGKGSAGEVCRQPDQKSADEPEQECPKNFET